MSVPATALQAEFMRIAYPDAEWDRSEYIGGTDIAPAMNLHPFCSREQRMREKLGLEPPFTGNWATKIGSACAPLALAEYSSLTNRTLIVEPPPPEVPDRRLRLIHPEREWLRGSLDGWAPDDRIVVEAKLVGPAQAKKWGPEWTDKIPTEYLCQVALYMALANCETAHVVALVLGFGLSKTDCRFYEVKRDREFEKQMLKAADEFYGEMIIRRGELHATGK